MCFADLPRSEFMLPKIMDIFARRETAALPVAEAPPAVPEIAVVETGTPLAAVRETIEWILRAQGLWQSIVDLV